MLVQFAEKFLERRRENASHWREVIFVQHLLKFFRKRATLSSIQTEAVYDYRMWRKSQGVSNATVNREVSCLKRMFNLAIQWGDARANPVSGIKPLKEPKYPDYCLTQEEAERLIDSCADYFRPIVILALNTGMRRNEILTMTWERVKLDMGYIELVNTKSNEKRYVTLNETAVGCLSQIVRQSEFVFVGSHGQPLKSIRKPWASAKRKAGIDPEFRFHDLRHTFISHSIMKGVDLFTIAQQVGHRDLRMINDRYGHLLSEHRQKSVRAIDGMFAPSQSRHTSRHTAKIVELPKVVND